MVGEWECGSFREAGQRGMLGCWGVGEVEEGGGLLLMLGLVWLVLSLQLEDEDELVVEAEEEVILNLQQQFETPVLEHVVLY